jgi:enoyl-CoA hydratase/carnithine racemase
MAEVAKKAEAAPAAAAAKPAEKPAESKGDKFEAAKAKAPGLTKEFVSKHNLDDDYLDRVARGEEPPPPTSAEVAKAAATTDGELHLTDAGWQITPKGVKPEDVGKDAISR